MAIIIEFRGTGTRGETRAGDDVAPGEIIIFPGVRRERHADIENDEAILPDTVGEERAAKVKRGRAKPKRDRLELPD